MNRNLSKDAIAPLRTPEEMAKSFYDSLARPTWLWWSLHRERLAQEDKGITDDNYYRHICVALDALNLGDIAETRRAILSLASSLRVKIEQPITI